MKSIVLMWTAIAVVLVALSMDFWRWDEPVTLSVLGMPAWVMFFIGLQLVLALALLVFARRDWDLIDSSQDDP